MMITALTDKFTETDSARRLKRPSCSSLGEITAKLTAIWQEMLRIEPILPDQNYFDIGGDSIIAVQMFLRIEQEFQVKLPLATLFDAPTIGALAQVLQEESSVSGWQPLVPIQSSGSRPAFFCMHGAGGNVLIYRELAQLLGSDQPVYGLQSRGLDGQDPPLTKIEEMATLYLKHIRKQQPHGPYLLGGYCMGGTVAYEVAQQLRAAGEDVALLALFDTMDWSKVPLPNLRRKTFHSFQRMLFHVANFSRLSSDGKLKFLSEKFKMARNRVPVWVGTVLAKLRPHSNEGVSEARVLAAIWQANDQACIEYVPKPYPGEIIDFRPLKQYTWFDRKDAKWDRLALGGEKVVVLPVYPAGMLVKPFVEHLASSLRTSIDEAAGKRNTI